jgi:HD-like signal output (HDOD) protein
METQAIKTATLNATTINAKAFAFVEMLALELSDGRIELPAFPDVAVRLRRVLSDESVSSAQVVKVVSAEPALVARLLMSANSAAMNPQGPRVTDLRNAVTRLGFNLVRSAALAFAMDQIRKSKTLVPLLRPLAELWERSVLVAALSYVLAKRCSTVNPDAALLAGLLHGVGRLYILTRSARHPELFEDPATYHEIVRDWHANVAKAILENWEISDEIVQAVEE